MFVTNPEAYLVRNLSATRFFTQRNSAMTIEREVCGQETEYPY